MAILVVDDSRAMRMIVKRELRKAGYDEVVEAENGAAALPMLPSADVELILSDWNMPDMNGIDFLSNLRASGNEVKFGFVTSESAPAIRQKAFETGANFVIVKPFTSDDLEREIGQALGGKAGAIGGASSAERTIDSVLEGLLGRDVTVKPAESPQRELARGVAEYVNNAGDKTIFGVFEMPLTAALACALARIPAGEAKEWAKAHAFSDAMEANFFEVANVLAAFASAGNERFALKAVHALSENELKSEMKDLSTWHNTVTIDVDGYPTGRCGFLA